MILPSTKYESNIKMNAIQPRPKTDAQAIIAGAPDGQKPAKEVSEKPKRERGTAISLTLPAELLASVDKAAKEKNLSRASFIKLVLSDATKWGD